MSEELTEAGGVVTAGLIVREIERARAGAPAVGHAADEPCANCGTIRHGPYCHACGQSGHVHRTAGALIHDIAHGVFHFEGKIWRTLPMLALRPGELTRRYIHGERARFVSPMALFLFSVFLMFAAFSALGGPVRLAAKNEADQARLALRADRDRATAELDRLERRRSAVIASRGNTAEIDRAIQRVRIPLRVLGAGGGATAAPPLDDIKLETGWPALDRGVRHIAEDPKLAVYKFQSSAYKFSWALIPISLPFIWLAFAFRRDVGLYDHAVFATYSLAAVSLLAIALTLLDGIGAPGGLTFAAMLLITPAHMYRQLRGAYRIGRFAAAWRTFALLMGAAVSLLIFAALLLGMQIRG